MTDMSVCRRNMVWSVIRVIIVVNSITAQKNIHTLPAPTPAFVHYTHTINTLMHNGISHLRQSESQDWWEKKKKTKINADKYLISIMYIRYFFFSLSHLLRLFIIFIRINKFACCSFRTCINHIFGMSLCSIQCTITI